MKKILYFAFVLLPIVTLAQNFQGKVTYEWKASSEEYSKMIIQPDMDPVMKKFLEGKIKMMFHKTYILDFDKTASLYKEDRVLDLHGDGFVPNNSDDGNEIAYFKDLKTKELVLQKEFYSKDFTIKEPLENFDWKMESETKKISEYLCYKATAVVQIRGTLYGHEIKEEERSTNFLKEKEKPTEKTVTAWYAPEIPVSQGPENYWGLPGFILEINDGNAVTLCTKIVMNPKEKARIKEPTKGKVITQNEYDETVTKKMQEMREQFKSNGGRPSFRMGN